MSRIVAATALVLIGVVGGWYLIASSRPAPVQEDATVRQMVEAGNDLGVQEAPPPPAAAKKSLTVAPAAPDTTITTASVEPGYSKDQLLAMAGPIPDSVPLGDERYTTNEPKKGYVYLCNVRKDNPGSMVNGPWIHGSSWTPSEKVSVSGSVSWPNASLVSTITNSTRIFSGNGLPINHTTGSFPVEQNDPAYQYDRNPNTIAAQTLKQELPLEPEYSDTPYCMGGEVGVMLSGVALFNAFDAGLRDAPAHELQDSCEGHPQGSGEYHYHSLSSCFKNIDVSTVLGYALDGFPITGPRVADGKYLSTDDLDECHGLISDVGVDGQVKRTYHYVLTSDFPYSASCFRGKPVSMMVIQSAGAPPGGMRGPGMPPPR